MSKKKGNSHTMTLKTSMAVLFLLIFLSLLLLACMNALFGGARPRELVLKERGVDEAAINNYGAVEETNRVEHDRDKKLSEHSMPTHYFEKIKEAHQRATSEHERRDQWVDDAERTQVGYWTDRQLPPEMFHNPIEQQKLSLNTYLKHHKMPKSLQKC